MSDDQQTSTSRTQAQRRAESEERLLNAAIEILARKGLVGMTLSEVGERAGASRGLPAHYFGNKAGLVQALAKRISRSFDEHMKSAPAAAPGLPTLIQFIKVYLGRSDPKWTTTRTLLLLLAESLTINSENAPVPAYYE